MKTEIEPMPPPFSYCGGKQRIASKIISHIPRHTVYAEPFCGGATLLFRKPYPKITNNDHYREYINDIDERLINFFRVLRGKDSAELIKRLELTLYSESEYKLSKEILKNMNDYDNVNKAWAFFVNINQSFCRQLFRGWGRSIYKTNVGKLWVNKVEYLVNYIERMRDVHISNNDAVEFIKQIDAPQVFFYLDPPYPETDQGHYKGYSSESFQKLVDVLENIKGSMILSCYELLKIEIPDTWKKIEIDAYCSGKGIGGKHTIDRTRKMTDVEIGDRKRTEILYIKKALQPRSEIQELYDKGIYDCFTGNGTLSKKQKNRGLF